MSILTTLRKKLALVQLSHNTSEQKGQWVNPTSIILYQMF